MKLRRTPKKMVPTQRRKYLLIRIIPILQILPTHIILIKIVLVITTMEVLSRIRITILETPALIIVNLSNRLSLHQNLLFISITSASSYQKKVISNMAKKHMRNKFQNILKFIGTNAMSAMNILMMKQKLQHIAKMFVVVATHLRKTPFKTVTTLLQKHVRHLPKSLTTQLTTNAVVAHVSKYHIVVHTHYNEFTILKEFYL